MGVLFRLTANMNEKTAFAVAAGVAVFAAVFIFIMVDERRGKPTPETEARNAEFQGLTKWAKVKLLSWELWQACGKDKSIPLMFAASMISKLYLILFS